MKKLFVLITVILLNAIIFLISSVMSVVLITSLNSTYFKTPLAKIVVSLIGGLLGLIASLIEKKRSKNLRRFPIYTLFSVFLLVIAVTIFSQLPKSDNYFVNGADFKDYGLLDKVSETPEEDRFSKRLYPAKAHELSKGNNIVLIMRVFRDPIFLAIDDEQYEKVTISIDKSIFKEGSTKLPNQFVRAISSNGGAAWPEGGCHGYLNDGYIDILEIKKKIIVNLKLNFKFKNFSYEEDTDKCEKYNLNLKEKFNEILFSDLSPYFGNKAKHPYEATYRN